MYGGKNNRRKDLEESELVIMILPLGDPKCTIQAPVIINIAVSP